MRQRVRCPHCHHWTDALLVWAAGDCCPSCNTPIAGFGGAVEETDEERALRPPLHPPSRFSQPGLGRVSDRRLNR